MVEIFDDRACALGEAPFWVSSSGRAHWVDVPASRVLWREPSTGAVGEVPVAAPVSAAVPREGGGFVLCAADGPVLVDSAGVRRDVGTFAVADAVAGMAGGPPVRANDAKADPVGRLFVGTLPLDGTAGAGALYRLDPAGTGLRRVLGGVGIANGLAWSPDGATMYFADTMAGRVDAFAYDVATGEMAGCRPFVDFRDHAGAGKPDGLCTDAAGGVWVACWGGGRVLRFTADGVLERSVEVPTPQVSSYAG